MYKENCIKITLDTSVIDPNNLIIKQLVEWRDKKVVKIYVELHSVLEIENWKNKKREEKLLWIERFGHQDKEVFEIPEGMDVISTIEKGRGFTFDQENKTELGVRSVHSPETKRLSDLPPGKKGLSKYVDWQIFTSHIMHKRDFFVTKNTREFIHLGKQLGVRLKRYESLFKNIKIREPNESLINEIKKELDKRNLI
ncbi:MAG: hypothetical protein PHD81_03435 [Candidatus Nanoarchaeia archaeon]|nr:hypothetical protein [Candidatus Nanoarchaeia archaeon]MDD5588137.1 hypothetical protein [Candidatus Nanoarchaeia archaeon]